MTTELAVAERGLGAAARRGSGASCSGRRCRRGCRSGSQARSSRIRTRREILVSLLQLLAVATFAALYTLTPKAFDPQTVPFEPVPVTLAVYAGFTLIRLWLAWQRRLQAWFLALSVVVDITRADGHDLELPSAVSGAAADLPEGADHDVRLHPDRAAHAALRALAGAARRRHRRGRLAGPGGLCGAGRGRGARSPTTSPPTRCPIRSCSAPSSTRSCRC